MSFWEPVMAKVLKQVEQQHTPYSKETTNSLEPPCQYQSQHNAKGKQHCFDRQGRQALAEQECAKQSDGSDGPYSSHPAQYGD